MDGFCTNETEVGRGEDHQRFHNWKRKLRILSWRIQLKLTWLIANLLYGLWICRKRLKIFQAKTQWKDLQTQQKRSSKRPWSSLNSQPHLLSYSRWPWCCTRPLSLRHWTRTHQRPRSTNSCWHQFHQKWPRLLLDQQQISKSWKEKKIMVEECLDLSHFMRRYINVPKNEALNHRQVLIY